MLDQELLDTATGWLDQEDPPRLGAGERREVGARSMVLLRCPKG